MSLRIPKTKRFIFLLLSLSIGMLMSCTSVTRYSCHDKRIDADKAARLAPVVTAFEEWLDQSGAQLLIAARRGQNLDKHGVEFSHAAFLKKETTGWSVYHLLTICPNDCGGIFQQEPINFLAPASQNYRIAAVIPTAEIQERLLLLLDSPSERDSVLDTRYNAAAYPFTAETQNSNGWLLEFFTKAVADTAIHNREQAVQWLQQDRYEPELVNAGKIKQLLTNIVMPHMSTRSQPADEKRHNRIWINTADSTLRYIARYSTAWENCQTPSTHLGENICIFQASN